MFVHSPLQFNLVQVVLSRLLGALTQEKTTWSTALSWARGNMGLNPSFPIALDAALMSLGMRLKSAPYRRPVGGVSVPSMLMTSAPPLITPAAPIAALSTSGTPTSGVTALPPQLVYSAMSWNWHMLTLSGIMLTCVTRGLTSSCVVATF